jgi:hypothetical protein
VSASTEIARRPIVEARAIVAERGYQPTAEDIRALRQTIIARRTSRAGNRWSKPSISTARARCSSRNALMSGMVSLCSMTLKNMSRQPRLTFLGFELDPQIIEQFRQQNPTADALTDLDAREGIRGRQLADVPEHVCLLGLQKGRDGRRAEVAARDRALCRQRTANKRRNALKRVGDLL